MQKNVEKLNTPYQLIDLDQLHNNLMILDFFKQKTNCKILFAIKAYSNTCLFKYISEYLNGICASGLFEAKLGRNFFGKEVHTFSSAYKSSDIEKIASYSDFVIFNSTTQWNNYNQIVRKNNAIPGIRINPEYSEIERFNVNPCHKHSRFGVHKKDIENIMKEGVNYFHFHTMCEEYYDVLERSTNNFLKIYENYLEKIEYLNLGGGQLLTTKGYNIDKAIKLINNLQDKYHVKVYLEPGEAVLANTGYLIASVIDIVDNGIKTAILDASAICHLPDTVYSDCHYIIKDGFAPKEKNFEYCLAGASCYAGDLFGYYSFEEPLQIGSKVVFCDTGHYTTVKNNMFNGIPFPTLVLYSQKYGYEIKKTYDYSTFLSII